MHTLDFRNTLTRLLARCPNIVGIGQTGDLSSPLVPGQSDIDLFVLCDTIPTLAERTQMYEAMRGEYESLSMNVCEGGVWGTGDIFIAEGIDVMPMYFTVSETRAFAESVLSGSRIEKEGRFYPIGRLASIDTLHILFEHDNAWTDIQNRVRERPQSLFDQWYASESSRILDEEDLGRAALRHEVLFFHQVTEEFLDHFLQSLYAKNRCYFPSRKRTEQAVSSFVYKPRDCVARLLKIARCATCADTIEDAICEMRDLANELNNL